MHKDPLRILAAQSSDLNLIQHVQDELEAEAVTVEYLISFQHLNYASLSGSHFGHDQYATHS